MRRKLMSRSCGLAARCVSVAAAFLTLSSSGHAEEPLGTKPAYVTRKLAPIPNVQALTRRIWLPGLQDGYVPQGLVYLDGKIFVSSYRSTTREQDRGPCRLFAMDAQNGAVLGHLDLPESCGHAGGLAIGQRGHLLVIDTRVLFEVELTKGQPIGRVLRSVKIRAPVKGSFGAIEADGFWLGQYERKEPAYMHKFAWASLAKDEITEADAVAVLPIPIFAQGAAFDAAGELWLTRSGSKLGELVKLDRETGAVIARFEMPAGIEGISFEKGGALWALSEAGSQRWSAWAGFYPLALRFEIGRLK